MTAVRAEALPPATLIAGYHAAGNYTDCFVALVPDQVSQARYIEAFYTSWLFKLERLVLATLVAKPSSDAGARRLAKGEADAFAAWTVETRTAGELLMCDYQGLTRSWLMSETGEGGTVLRFGTVVTPGGRARTRRTFEIMTPLHRIYARALLRAAAGRLASVAG